MAKIKLLSTKEYAKKKDISRVTVWRRTKNGVLDYYILPGSKKRWFAEKGPDIFRTEQKFLDEILSIETI